MKKSKQFLAVAILIWLVAFMGAGQVSTKSTPDIKTPTAATIQANAQYLNTLPFNNKEDFEFAKRGLIAKPDNLTILGADGHKVWDMAGYSFIAPDSKSPDSVNPSLWRQAQLNNIYGLFKVTDRIYQVRGYDLSNITFVQGDTGWIVFDPLISAECSRAALDLLNKTVGKRPVIAVIYSHSHIDHYGGVKGVASEEDVKNGKVRIIAPEGFMKAALDENVMAGTAMSRRAMYMYGALLPKSPTGGVDTGLGKVVSEGTIALIVPTETIGKTGQELTIDGVKMVFQYTPGTEAPVEMNTYFPQFRALWMAENCVGNLHNLYTLRGAQVRDSYAWAYFLNESIDLFGDKSDLMFTAHHWPRFGQANVVKTMASQRDMYKYLHDQTLRLANQGYTMIEIAEMMTIPDSLANEWYNRGYYGSVNHDVKAIYQKYLGWFDGNPANLHALPPVEASKKYVDFMGGAAAVTAKARKSYQDGDYRWVAQVMNHVVFADPSNQEARNLEADAFEQLGYQAESGVWRNFYLTGAMELRQGVKKFASGQAGSADTIKAMPVPSLLDFLGICLNGPKAAGVNIVMNISLTDTNEKYTVTLENSVLLYTVNKLADKPDVGITLTRSALNELLVKSTTFEKKIASGELKIHGNPLKLKHLFSLFDQFEPWFNIVTP